MASQQPSDLTRRTSLAEVVQDLTGLLPQRFLVDVQSPGPMDNRMTKVIKATLAYVKNELPAVLELSGIAPERYFDSVAGEEAKEDLSEVVMRAALAYVKDLQFTITSTEGQMTTDTDNNLLTTEAQGIEVKVCISFPATELDVSATDCCCKRRESRSRERMAIGMPPP